MTPGQPCAGWGTTHTCPPWGQTKNKSNHSLLLHTPKSGREGGLSQTGPLPCMLQLHLAYQSYKSLTKHSQSQGTFNLPQQGIDLPNPTVGGLPSLSWCKVNSKPKQHCRGVETQIAGDPRPALCWLGHHSYMPTKAKPSTPQPAERSGATPLTQIMRAQQRLLQTYLHRSHKLISNNKSLHLPKC